MKNRLYVGNLDPRVSRKRLADLFSQVGKVKKVKIVTDKETGGSKGFAFVEMNNQKEVKKAIEKLNGEGLEGRFINVNEAGESDK